MNLLNTLRSMQQTYAEIAANDTLNEIEAAKYEMIRGLLKSVDNRCIQEDATGDPGEYMIKITGSGSRDCIADALQSITDAMQDESMPVSDISGTWGSDCTLSVILNP